MRLGAHVSIAGGLAQAVDRGVALDTECIQIFVSSPRTWHPLEHDPAEVARFKEKLAQSGISPVLIHTIYLINLASPDLSLFKRSIDALTQAMRWAERLGVEGVITHLGSGMGQPEPEVEQRVAEAISIALENAPGSGRLLLETSAGHTVGGHFAQVGRIIRSLGEHPRLAVCLDTAHVFAAGYDFRTIGGLNAMLDRFDRQIGLSRLAAVHANDSKTSLGSGVDRHENIGRGCIGPRAFARLLRHPALQQLPFVLEVPGLAGTGPDLANMATLRRLAGKPPSDRVGLD